MELNLLLIEDSDSDASLDLRALEKAGFEVSADIVTTAEEMQKALANRAFDVVLSDHNLPQFDSVSALAIFKASGLDIPFIIVSGAIGEETAVSLMKSGAQDYVMKSNLARLAPAVQRELKEAEVRRQQKQAEAQLQISEARFRQVAEVAGEMIWEVDADLKYLYISPVAAVVTGYQPDELVGQMHIFDLFPESARQDYTRDLLERLNQKKCRAFVSPRVCKSGRVIFLETSAMPVLDNSGRVLGYRGTDTDITERKQMEARIGDLYQQEKLHSEQLLEEARVKNLCIDVLAHELRNSMTSIVVSSDMLRDGREMRPDIKDRLVININDGAKALTRRLDELLDLARYSKGTFVLNKQTVDGPKFLREVIARYKPNLDKRQQILTVIISSDLHSVNIDISRMEQVIVNLLSNASKYSAEKTEIVLKAGPRGPGLFLEVVDHGIGISSEDQAKIFQPYYRACKNQEIQGVGLGMAVSHQIIQAHGGSISVASQPGEGSTFSVLIPEARS